MPINYDVVEDSRVETINSAAKPPKNNVDKNKKKKRGGFGLLKAALLMIRGRKDARKSLVSKETSNWKKLLGSVRPMHHQPILPKTAQSSPVAQSTQANIPPQASPVATSSGNMSQYASASSLQDLDDEDDDDEEDPDQVFDTIRGDELIDSKADEFIAHFYRQMRLQNTTPDHELHGI